LPPTIKAQEYTKPYRINTSNITSRKRASAQTMVYPKPENDLATQLRDAESAFENSIVKWLAVVYPTGPPFTASLTDENLRDYILLMSEYHPVYPNELENYRREKLGSRVVKFLEIAVQDYGIMDVKTLVVRIRENFDKLIDMRDSLWSLEAVEAGIKDS
jgi:hypothetical protein